MQKILFTLMLTVSLIAFKSEVSAQNKLPLPPEADSLINWKAAPSKGRKVVNNAFKVNELLHFRVSYGNITAGYATMEVNRQVEYKKRQCYVLKTTAQSRKAFDWIFKVRDWTESYVDIEKFYSLRFEKHLSEGSYKKDIVIEYDQERNQAVYVDEKKKAEVIAVPPDVLDPLSALYLVRNMDLQVGKDIYLPSTDNKTVYPIRIIVHKIESVKVEAGKFFCYVVEPVMADGGIFKKDGKVKIWLTADKRRMPVKMETKVYIGSIVAELDWFEAE